MPNQVNDIDKKNRSRRLNELSHELETKFYKEHLNKILEVLIEEVKDNESIGFTSNYIRVKIPSRLVKNEFYKIVAEALDGATIVGRIIEEGSDNNE
jgi:threonylcarbamoyladenosine tRNA methylthiotransferase MtaB